MTDTTAGVGFVRVHLKLTINIRGLEGIKVFFGVHHVIHLLPQTECSTPVSSLVSKFTVRRLLSSWMLQRGPVSFFLELSAKDGPTGSGLVSRRTSSQRNVSSDIQPLGERENILINIRAAAAVD